MALFYSNYELYVSYKTKTEGAVLLLCSYMGYLMSISSFFSELGVVLRSREWSRGGISSVDGSVFLLVWQDEIKRRNGYNWAYLATVENVESLDKPSLKERLDHIKLIKSGKRAFLIFCESKLLISGERVVSTFNAERVYPIGEIVTYEKGLWAQYLTGILVRDLRQTSR